MGVSVDVAVVLVTEVALDEPMIPIDVYKTSRPWWRRKWQAELTIEPQWDKAVTAFTERGCFNKAVRRYEREASQ
jgi:hypothetical protein